MPKRRAPEKPSRDEPRPAPAGGGRPWWVIAAVVAVVAVVAAIQMVGEDRTAGQDVEEIPLDAVPTPPERLRVRILQRHPHDRDAFTQGLLWHDGVLYESTGLRHRSTLRKVELDTGEVDRRRALAPELFAEGLALVGDRLIQLTWTSGQAHVWSLGEFDHQRTFQYQGEGWGLCYDGEHLVMSNGSAELTFRDPETFRVERRVTVRDSGRPVRELNELECVDGVVWANVWQTDRIVRIDPSDGTRHGRRRRERSALGRRAAGHRRPQRHRFDPGAPPLRHHRQALADDVRGGDGPRRRRRARAAPLSARRWRWRTIRGRRSRAANEERASDRRSAQPRASHGERGEPRLVSDRAARA